MKIYSLVTGRWVPGGPGTLGGPDPKDYDLWSEEDFKEKIIVIKCQKEIVSLAVKATECLKAEWEDMEWDKAVMECLKAEWGCLKVQWGE